MKSKLFILMLIFYSFSYSQQKIIDSLNLELDQFSKPNKERLDILNELGYYYYQINAEKGLEINDDAIQLAKQLDLPNQLAIAYKNKGNIYRVMSQDSMAHIMIDKAIELNTQTDNQIELGKSIFNKGLVYFGQSNYLKANACNLQAYEIFEKKNNSILMAKMLNSVGINLMYQTQYPEAIDAYLKASSIYEDLNLLQSEAYANIINNIGLLYNRMSSFDEAFEYMNKALSIYEILDFQQKIADCYTNLGIVLDNLEQPQESIDYYQKSYDIMEKIGNKIGMANAMTNTGIAYITLENYPKALEYLNKTKVIYKEAGNINNLAIVLDNIGLSYLKSFDENQNNRPFLIKAKYNFEKAREYSKQVGDIKSQVNALENLALVNVKLNNYKEAYHVKLEAVKMKDSFYSSEKKEEIVEIKAKYEYEKKEASLKASHSKEQAISEAEIKHQKLVKNISIFGGSTLSITILASLILYKRKRDIVSQKKEADFNTKVAETELKVLRAQMNPHFIYNSLNSIGDYILKNDTESATNYLTKFAKLMRQTLENSTKKEILLKDDISLITMYLDIENKRFNNRFTYNINIENNIDIDNTLVPPLILQPFIENSIIHGFINKDEKGHIDINVSNVNDMIIYSVEDNGIGRQNTLNENKKSFGMKITKNRIDIINKIKEANGVIQLIDKDKGLKVVVSFPLELAF